MNEAQAQAAFSQALASHSPGFGSFFLARLLGLAIEYPGETCSVAFEVADWMYNPQGTLHGGIIGTVLDISMGHLLQHAVGAGATLEMKVQYLRPVQQGRAVCTGAFVRRGRSINFMEARLVDATGRLCATATATWMLPASA